MDSGVASLIGVVVGASLASLKEFVTFFIKQRSGKVYLVSRIAPMLDDFIAKCAAVAKDEGEENQERISYPSTTTPKLNLDDLDVDWRSLPAPLMRELLELPYRIELADNAIAAEGEFSDPPDHWEFFEERRTQYAKLGLDTKALLDRLLAAAKLPERSARKWDPIEVINRELKEITERQEARERRYEELMKKAPPAPPLPGFMPPE